jgi:predicted metal-dependent hydrolase
MTELVVRRLLIDLEQPLPRHWCGNDAFRTALFNALSMSFPVGEQFFIDSVRNGYKALAPAQQEKYKDEVQGFIGQEATHRRIHALFNAHLEQQGLVNGWATRALQRQKLLADTDVRHWLAITAANEHFTAIFAEWLLGNPHWLDGSQARLKTMWLWHSAEESEHKCTAFDLYRALGGNEAWRRIWMRRVTLMFLGEAMRQTISNLRHDGTLWRWSTWRSAAGFYFGKGGVMRASYRPWRNYMRADFHPGQGESGLSQAWLQDNAAQFTVVGG